MGNSAIDTHIFCINPSIHAGTAQTDHTELRGWEAPALDSTSVYQNNQIDEKTILTVLIFWYFKIWDT